MEDLLSKDDIFLNVAYNVFMPPRLPQKALGEDQQRQVDRQLALSTRDAAMRYLELVPDSSGVWDRMSSMLSRFAESVSKPFDKRALAKDMTELRTNDVLSLHIREQNAAVIIHKSNDSTTFAVFEGQAPAESVMSVSGKLVRHFPGPAIQVPNNIAEDPNFISEIANFLVRMNVDILDDAVAKSRKAGSDHDQDRDARHPHYISQLFTGILRGFGAEIEPRRVVKRIADEVLWDSAPLPWRRSPVWLIIRVALQTAVSHQDYKHFMVYLHAHLVDTFSTMSAFSSDLLAATRMKMARRMLKVKTSLPISIVQFAEVASNRAGATLKGRWDDIQNQVPGFGPLNLDTDRAVIQTLPSSRGYLAKVLQGRSGQNESTEFSPDDPPRLAGHDFSVFADGELERSFKKNRHLALFDFEHAVYHHLVSWTEDNLRRDSARPCEIIASCIDQYAAAASSHYKQDVADSSIMILTIMELWVALDKLAISRHRILGDYSPEIPENLIETLLLRYSVHIERARIIQNHLRKRHGESSYGSVFTEKPSHTSLSIRVFANSSKLQSLKREIETEARRERDEKIEELNRMNEEHAELMKTISKSSHSYYEDAWGRTRHAGSCSLCSTQDRARKMTIYVHEWPLPSKELDAQNVVFELQCPEELDIWRSTTYKILCDIANSTRGGEFGTHHLLADYQGLQQWATPRRRITIASSTAPFSVTQYSQTKIPANEVAVCVPNGLTFRLYDPARATWGGKPFLGTSFSKYGTFILRTGSVYGYLQSALATTSHTSNQILADQAECPEELSLHEHYAFGTLRSGPQLQWMNIVRGLEENTLTFSREEVDMLHTQAAWQIGVLSEDGQTRQWHIELDNPEFGKRLVHQAFRVLDRVRSNWLEGMTVHTIVMLIARLLSVNTDPATNKEAYRFLRDARDVTFKWLKDLTIKLKNAEIDTQIQDYQERVCEMAAICRSTYDVDESHLRKILHSTKDFLALVVCSVKIYDNQPPQLHQAPPHLQALLCRNRRLSFKALPILLERVQKYPQVLDPSVHDCWESYRHDSFGWTMLSKPHSRWVAAATASDSRCKSQRVYLDLLEGRLLVEGKPIGRLPSDYVVHPIYTRLLGKKIIEVAPANVPGMDYTACDKVYGHEISFSLDYDYLSLDESGDLIVQARLGSNTFELIPHSELIGDFPLFFSSDYHHWMDLASGVVEFRPLAQPWTSCKENWRLRFSTNPVSTMEKHTDDGFVTLLDLHSDAFRDISRRITPLETDRYIHVTRSNRNSAEIRAELPRMKLSFFVNQDLKLESQNFHGQVIDENQSSGTLFGLNDQLILCAKDPVAKLLPQSRSVLVPYGVVIFERQDNHVKVTIDRGSKSHVAFYQYKIDVDVGYLANSNDSLTSRLFKIYLHALTSHCLPDPLTGRTGTEEALYELSEPATTSFEQIDEDQAQLLQLIGALTPKRVYYPAHLKAMQKVVWNPLPALAQHYAFCTAANSVLRRAESLQLFSSLAFKLDSYVTEFEGDLLRRAAHRTRMYYPLETVEFVPNILGEQLGTDTGSVQYEPKDHSSEGWSEKGQHASWTSQLVRKWWGTPTYITYDLVSLFELWETVSGPSSDLKLTYGRAWLKLELPRSWLSLFNLCREALSANQYALGICLASGIYSGTLPLDLVPVLVSFATNPQFRNIVPPPHSSYNLSDKYEPTEYRITLYLNGATHDIESTPSMSLPRRPNESVKDWGERRRVDYISNISQFKSHLTQTWLKSRSPQSPQPNSSFKSWFDIDTCLSNVKSYFKNCSMNSELRKHLYCLQAVLSSQSTTTNLQYSTMPTALPRPTFKEPSNTRVLNSLSVFELMKYRDYPTLRNIPREPSISQSSTEGCTPDTHRLSCLLAEFQTIASHPLYLRYGSDLEESLSSLSRSSKQATTSQLPPVSRLEENRSLYKDHLNHNFGLIRSWLGPVTPIESVVFTCGIWPPLTPRNILSKMALRARKCMSLAQRYELQKYARAYVEYQRSHRLIGLAQGGKHDEFMKELSLANADYSNEANDIDWLLVQIDGNFSTRTVQTKVAREMISPSSSESTVLQLNMGEGKSSVIVPIVAAALADSTRLVRVIVLKPLWRQMFHLLASRLSGLAGRRVYYLPFGRHIRVGQSHARLIREMYEECMREGGILLAQPEHILSFKLMGIDRLLSPSSPEFDLAAESLRETQEWLSRHTRDVLDESDEILHVRYQLVYTMGRQKSLEGQPDRWTTAQHILALVANHIRRLEHSYDKKLEYEERDGGQFPLVRIMPESDAAVAEIVRSVAEDAIGGLIPNLNLKLLAQSTRKEALRFMTDLNIPESETLKLQALDSSTRAGLLLIRGLLACGIIAFALRDKHYRVDYGLDRSRSLLAVPYQAKDIPSLRAEFGHPDVAIVLTYLSYYNHGLTPTQLNTSFELLYKLDNPALEYEQWASQNEQTPSDLRQLNGVNLKDREQFEKELVPTFSKNSAVVNFFLSSVVFPKEAKEFPHKLSTSGWDLAEIKNHVTTGFSGTNDNRYLLPTSIAQSDPVKQSSTNALVLTYLLQPENNHYVCTRNATGETCSATEFLEILVKQKPEIRVLLDVGAQMLEFTNDELVRCWLKLRPDIAAAVYFNDKDELVILPQGGSAVSFYSSPFSQQLDKCIVYLDDGHTRGTDLKLPKATRAAVTLGPKVTKDRLLQGM